MYLNYMELQHKALQLAGVILMKPTELGVS